MANTHTTPETDAGIRTGTERGRNARNLIGWIGIIGIVASLLWGAWVMWHLSDDFESMVRTEIPGQVTVDIEEPGQQVVYYERSTWVATPVDPGIDISVRGPDGSAITAEPTTRLQYRMLRTVRQAQASFTVAEPGSYTVMAEGQPAHEGATLSVGAGGSMSTLARLIGPIVLLAAAVVVTVWAGARRWFQSNVGGPDAR